MDDPGRAPEDRCLINGEAPAGATWPALREPALEQLERAAVRVAEAGLKAEYQAWRSRMGLEPTAEQILLLDRLQQDAFKLGQVFAAWAHDPV